MTTTTAPRRTKSAKPQGDVEGGGLQLGVEGRRRPGGYRARLTDQGIERLAQGEDPRLARGIERRWGLQSQTGLLPTGAECPFD